jgi:hypothetical protein
MLPDIITHHGTQFGLRHLHPKRKNFSWLCRDGVKVIFSVTINFSDHCVSEDYNDVSNIGAHCFGNGREFCPDRHAWSLGVPTIIDNLFVNPTTQVRLTAEKNWFVFQLSMQPKLPAGERYYCFFKPRHHELMCADPVLHKFSLYVESAYPRKKPPNTPHSKERLMFGRLMERLMP